MKPLSRSRRPLRRAKSALAGVVALAALIDGGTVRPAFAQGSDPATARALFAEGRKLMSEKKYEDACPKFEESLRLDHGMGTQFNLAFCWEQLGRTASAWATFLDVAAAARAAGQSEREVAARDRAAALEPRLSRLTIRVPTPVEGLEITRDEVTVGRPAWGSAVPVDPGTHTLKASAPGKKPWQQAVSVAAGGARISVDVPQLEDAPVEVAAATVAEPAASRADERAPGSEPSMRDEGVNGTRVAAWVVGGAGLVALGAGTYFGLKFLSERDRYDGLCLTREACPEVPGQPPNEETLEFYDAKDKTKKARNGAYVSFGIAGAALVTSTILFIVSGQDSERGDITVTPLMAGDDGWGAAVSGRF